MTSERVKSKRRGGVREGETGEKGVKVRLDLGVRVVVFFAWYIRGWGNAWLASGC